MSHLKQMDLPKFDGTQDAFFRWKQRFKRLVDEDPFVNDDYKLTRLKEAVVGGSAEDLIAGIIDGPGAYSAAWNELDLWYGGEHRFLQRQERDVMNLPPADRPSAC